MTDSQFILSILAILFSGFFASLFGALAGSVSGHFFTARRQRRKQIKKLLRGVNKAALAHTLCLRAMHDAAALMPQHASPAQLQPLARAVSNEIRSETDLSYFATNLTIEFGSDLTLLSLIAELQNAVSDDMAAVDLSYKKIQSEIIAMVTEKGLQSLWLDKLASEFSKALKPPAF